MTYRILLLGRPIFLRGSEILAIKSKKGQALLWYLASQPGETFSRNHLSELLWNDVPSDAARRDFNTMLSRLRAELPVPCLVGDRDRLGWRRDGPVSVDVDDFMRWTEGIVPSRSQDAPHRHRPLTSGERDALIAAVELWRGPFLSGFTADSEAYTEWLQLEREQWQARIVAALSLLVETEAAAGRWQQVMEAARRGLQIDSFHEPFHRAIMEALHAQGNRAGALAHYEACRTAFLTELGTDPHPLTTQLFHTIRNAPSAAVIMPHPLPHGPAASRRPLHGIRALAVRPPLVGRTRERKAAWAELNKAGREIEDGGLQQGRPRVVLLAGEAGIGKTRLLTALLQQALAQPEEAPAARTPFGTVLWGQARETTGTVPYAPLVEAFGALLPSVDVPSLGLADVWLRELGRLMPDAVPPRPGEPGGGTPEPIASPDDQMRLFQAVGRFLAVLPQPVLLALDDLHWSDPWSIALLTYLLSQEPPGLRLAVAATVRTGDESEQVRAWMRLLEREERLLRVELGTLDEQATRELVTALMPESRPELAARLYGHTRGHPLYIVEVIRALQQDGEEAAFELQEDAFPVPPTVQAMLTERLHRLGENCRAVAEAAAVFERAVSLDELRRVAELPESEAVSGLARLIEAGIIDEGHDGTFAFHHELFRRAIADRLSRVRRAYLHRRASAALPADPRNARDLQHIAERITHAVGGELWEEAARWAWTGAEVAEALFAFPTACGYLEQLLECLAKLPPTPERQRQALDARLRLARLDHWSPPDRRNARLDALAREAAALGATGHLPLIQLVQAEAYYTQGRCREALSLLEQLMPVVGHDPRLRLRIVAGMGAIHLITGDAARALAHFQHVMAAAGEPVRKAGTSVHGALAVCHASLGDFRRADEALAVMARDEQEQGYEGLTAKFHIIRATVAHMRGRWEETAEAARQALRTARLAHDAPNEVLALLWLGAARAELGHADDAIQSLEQARAMSERFESYIRRDMIWAYLALAYGRAGRYEEARAAVSRGLDIAETFGYREGHALCLEIRGRLAAQEGDVLEARQCLTEALRRYEELSNGPGADRCRRHLANLDPGSP